MVQLGLTHHGHGISREHGAHGDTPRTGVAAIRMPVSVQSKHRSEKILSLGMS